jgi:hypothetical protein
MRRTLLVFRANATEVEFAQYIEDFQIRAAGIAEKRIHTLGTQGLGQQLGPAQRTRPLCGLDVGQLPARDRAHVLVRDIVFHVDDVAHKQLAQPNSQAQLSSSGAKYETDTAGASLHLDSSGFSHLRAISY